MRTFLRMLIVFTVASATHTAVAEVELPAMFSDHMVVQRDQSFRVWGWAEGNEQITVSIAGRSAVCKAGPDGRWKVTLEPLQAGGPHVLTVKGVNSLTIDDVLVGEVWLCSGQSNMAMAVSGAMNYEQEQAAANLPQIRHFKTANHATPVQQDRYSGEWVVCTPDSVSAFTATGFFFGRELHKQLNVLVGLINSSWGGTAIEAWTSWPVQKDLGELGSLHKEWESKIASYNPEKAQAQYERDLKAWDQRAAKAKTAGRKPPRKPGRPADPSVNQNRPANLFNGMIHPLIPYAIRGAIWYQGERNSQGTIAKSYGLQLATLVNDWRERWGYEFPFLWVQLPNFTEPQVEPVESTGWVIVREGMRRTLDLPNTGMAVTIDIGEAGNIHPKNKQEVGRRLALWALAKIYGKPGVPCGPLYRSMARKGEAIIIRFDHVGRGLTAKGDKLSGFAIAGPDRQFVWADAKIVGETVVVSSSRVKDPVAVRYGWAPNPECSLYNTADLPASPFRTDEWPIEIDAGGR